MKNKKEWIDFLIKKSNFELSEYEKEMFEKDLNIFIEQLKDLDKFNLDGVKPSTMPFIKLDSILRDDENIKNDSLLENNSENFKDGFFYLKKGDK